MTGEHRLSRLDSRPLPGDLSDVCCVMCVRNEMLRLPWVLEYHRHVGVNRFFVIDNGSTDGSADYLLAQPDVHCFYTEDSYGESSFGLSWTNLVLDHFCSGHWVVVIDADELLVYPHCENTSLSRLCGYLDTTGARAVYTRMLDMYSSQPVCQIAYIPGESFLATCPYFDRTGYNTVPTPRLFPPYQIYGGVRKRIFWDRQGEDSCPPVLTKLALVKWSSDQKFLLSTHIMTPVPLAQLSGALLHFKFLGDFHERALRAVATEPEFDRSREYSVYASMLAADPQLTFYCADSIEYQGSDQLIALDIMKCPASFDTYLANTRTD